MKSKKVISTADKYKDNPRKITPEQQGLLKEHIEELGDLSGVVYCHVNKAFVGGNQRSDIFEGDPIEIIKTFSPPTKGYTVAMGYITHQGERFTYREVMFPPDIFKKACIVANNDGGTFDIEALQSNWNAEALKEWGLDIWQPDDVDLNTFFKPGGESKGDTKLIVLEYSLADYTKVVEAFGLHTGTREEIIIKLLGL